MSEVDDSPEPVIGSVTSAGGGLTPAHVEASEIWVPPPEPPKARHPMQTFDRFKLLALMAVLFVVFVWRQRADVPVMTLGDAIIEQLQARRWLLVLFVGAGRQLIAGIMAGAVKG